jgi:hypothetical protein
MRSDGFGNLPRMKSWGSQSVDAVKTDAGYVLGMILGELDNARPSAESLPRR